MSEIFTMLAGGAGLQWIGRRVEPIACADWRRSERWRVRTMSTSLQAALHSFGADDRSCAPVAA